MRSVLAPDQNVIQIYSTSEIVDLLLNNANKGVEARLILAGYFATHILQLKGKWLYDTGIDSEVIRTTTDELLQRYPNHEWILDQIV